MTESIHCYSALIGVAQARESESGSPRSRDIHWRKRNTKIHRSNTNAATCLFDRLKYGSILRASFRWRRTAPSLFNAKVICSLDVRFSSSWTLQIFRWLVLSRCQSRMAYSSFLNGGLAKFFVSQVLLSIWSIHAFKSIALIQRSHLICQVNVYLFSLAHVQYLATPVVNCYFGEDLSHERNINIIIIIIIRQWWGQFCESPSRWM